MIIRGKNTKYWVVQTFLACFNLQCGIRIYYVFVTWEVRKFPLTLFRVEREVKSNNRRVRSENEFIFMSGRLNFYFPKKPMTIFSLRLSIWKWNMFSWFLFGKLLHLYLDVAFSSIFIYRIVWNCCNEFRNLIHTQRPRLL